MFRENDNQIWIPLNDSQYDEQDADRILNQFTLLLEKHLISTGKLFPTICPATLKLSLSLIGGVAGIPAFEPATQFAGDNKGVGLLFGSSVTVSLGLLNAWAVLDYARYIETLELGNPEKFSVKKFSISLFSLMVGIVSALPTTYISYRFNDNNLVFAMMAFFLDTVTSTCAINQYARNARVAGKFLHKDVLAHRKDEMIEMLKNGMAARLKKSNVENLLGLEAADREALLISIIRDSQETLQLKNAHSTSFYGPLRTVTKYSNLFLPLPWALITVKLMNEAFSNYLVDSPYVSLPLAILTALPGYLLEYKLGSELLLRLYDNIMYLKHGMYQSEPGEYYHPYLVNSARLLGLFVTSLCFGAKATVINQEIPFAPLNQILLGVTIPGIILFKTSAIQTLCGKAANFLSKKAGEKDHREISALYEAVQDFNVVIANATPDEIGSLAARIETRLESHESEGNLRASSSNFTFFKKIEKTPGVVPEKSLASRSLCTII